MAKYQVRMRQVQEVIVEVDADSVNEAIEAVETGEGVEIDKNFPGIWLDLDWEDVERVDED